MTVRTRRRGADHESPVVDVQRVFDDDAMIDRIAQRPWVSSNLVASRVGGGCCDGAIPARHGVARRSAAQSAHARADPEEPLFELFEAWREELAAAPLPPPPDAGRLEPAALQRRPSSREPGRRSLRPALSIAAAIAALLVGSATIVSKDAAPNSALWPVTQVLWPNRVESVASVQQVRLALDEARSALQAGRTRDAQLALLRASTELGRVDDRDGRNEMQQAVQALWVEAEPTAEAVPGLLVAPATGTAGSAATATSPTAPTGAANPTTVPPVGANAAPVSTVGANAAAGPAAGTNAAAAPDAGATATPDAPPSARTLADGESSASGTGAGDGKAPATAVAADPGGTSGAPATSDSTSQPSSLPTPSEQGNPSSSSGPTNSVTGSSATEQSPPTPPATPAAGQDPPSSASGGAATDSAATTGSTSSAAPDAAQDGSTGATSSGDATPTSSSADATG